MKKVFTLIISLVAGFTCFSQLSIGLQGTGNLSDANFKADELINPSKKTRTLPGAGIVADLDLTPSLIVRSDLNYQQNGIIARSSFAGIPGEIDEIKAEAKFDLHYLQVPFQLLYSTKGHINFFVGGGPYVSLAVAGKTKTAMTYKLSDGTTVTEKEDSDPFEKDEEGNASFKRTDYGISAIAGLRLPSGLFANVGYQYSLDNISIDNGSEYKNRSFQLTIGYYIWRR